jgi:hypothetical protein
VPQLTLADIKKRITRLEQLARGLAREVTLQKEDDGRLLFRERRQYLHAIQDALAGAEQAGVVLVGVVKRMERGWGWPRRRARLPPDAVRLLTSDVKRSARGLASSYKPRRIWRASAKRI